MARADPLRGLRSLLGLLTVIPSGGSLEDAAAYVYLMPIVGFVRGLVTSASLLALIWFPPYVAAALALLLHYLIQGFMHADGFADFSEALLASRSGADPRAVLSDPHRGSFAVAALSTLSILIFASSLYAVSSRFVLALAAAEVGHVVAIGAALQFGRREPYQGMAGALKDRMSGGRLAAAAALSAAIIFLLGGGALCLMIPISSIIIGALAAGAANRVLGYSNGDVLGFAGEAAFVASLLMAAHA